LEKTPMLVTFLLVWLALVLLTMVEKALAW
jgi:hypothetical protein